MQIHVGRNSQQLGTFTPKQILDGLASGQFYPTDVAWHEGLTDWQPLSDLEVLSAATSAPVAPAAPPPVPQPIFKAQPTAVHQPVQTASSSLPGWSLGLGIASFLCSIFTAIPAIICGHKALGKIKRGEVSDSGRGMAIAGLIMGYIMFILPVGITVVAIVAGAAVPVFNSVQEKAIETKSSNQVRQIILGCKQYALDHDGSYPPDLETLVTDGIITDEKILHCPMLKDDTQIGYEYFGAGAKDSAAADKVIVISKAANRVGKRVIGYNDASVNVMEVPELPQSR